MIKLLEKHVAAKIAAGEVVDRPVSVVKELVENSIDAGADSITVEIKNGGKSYIRVSDNGQGIEENEVLLAFARHATSKIAEETDLESIVTLGFRGEALASIAAVSKVELLTKTRSSKMGRRAVLHGGEVIENQPYGCPDGTTFIVSDLFYNTPARLKFLKADNAESALIIELISQIAIAYPNIRISLKNNGNILFATNGKGNLASTIMTVYGKTDKNDLVPVHHLLEYAKVDGFVSSPGVSRSTRKSQVFFVNGRVVNSKVIEKGLNKAYSDRLFEGRYPIAYLFVETEPDKLDVNIHPNKKEVRFDDEEIISILVEMGVREALATKSAIPQVKSREQKTSISIRNNNDFVHQGSGYSDMFRPDEDNHDSDTVNERQELDEPGNDTQNTRQDLEKSDSDIINTKQCLTQGSKSGNISPKIREVNVREEQVDIKNILSSLREKEAQGETETETETEIENAIKSKTVSPRPFNFDDLRITGSIFATYITAVDDDSFYMIDQHAAHERIMFEKLLKQFMDSEKMTQPMMVPLMVNTVFAVSQAQEDWMPVLRNLGFEIEEFGANTYAVRAVPMFMDMAEAEAFLSEFLENAGSEKDFSNYNRLEMIISKSCKSAVKGNYQLHTEEMKHLLQSLAKCNNPYSCPHGRPTFIRFSKYEVERMFKRA